MSPKYYTPEERDLLSEGLTVRSREEMDWVDDLDEEELDMEPEEWNPAKAVRPSTPGWDGVPFFDDGTNLDPRHAPRSYPAWREGETHVVSGPLGDAVGRGRRFTTRARAKRWAREKFGYVLEEYVVRDRWILRVPSKRGGK